MFYLVLHTALLVLAAFILGAIVGCLLKRFLSGGPVYGAAAATRNQPVRVRRSPHPKDAGHLLDRPPPLLRPLSPREPKRLKKKLKTLLKKPSTQSGMLPTR
jgi:hypothetical protein